MTLPRLFPRRGMAPMVRDVRTSLDERMGGWSVVRGTDVPDVSRTGNEIRLAGWERHPVVHACVRAIVDLVAAVPLEAVTLDGDAPEPVGPMHPAQQLVDAPRVGLTPHRLMARTAMAYLLYGNGFWHLERRSRRGLPVGLRVINPERVQYVWTSPDDDPVGYDWRGLAGDLRQSPVEDVLHFRDLEARDGLFGYPRLAAALIDIDTDTRATNYVRQMVANHGVPGLVILTEGNVSPEDGAKAEAVWHEKMSARGERGRTKFLGGVKDVKPIGFDLAELEFPDLRGIAREDICAACGVDPRIIGLQSAGKDGGLSGAQYQEARFRLIQQSVIPVMKAIESEMNHWLAPEFGNVAYRFSPDGLAELTEDEGQTSTRVIAEVGAGIRTVEEARETVGLPGDLDPAHHLALGTVSLKQVKAALSDAETTTAELAEQTASLTASAPDDDEDEDEDAPPEAA